MSDSPRTNTYKLGINPIASKVILSVVVRADMVVQLAVVQRSISSALHPGVASTRYISHGKWNQQIQESSCSNTVGLTTAMLNV